MTVGVATDTTTGALDCQILDVTGDAVDVRPGSVSDSFVSASIEVDWEPVVAAEGLPAGEYSAVCAGVGEPSGSATTGGVPPSFGVSRVVTVDDMFDFVRPVFGIFAAIALGGVIGLIGLILMIVGLVIGNRSRRGPPGPPAPQYQQWGQNQWGQGQGRVRASRAKVSGVRVSRVRDRGRAPSGDLPRYCRQSEEGEGTPLDSVSNWRSGRPLFLEGVRSVFARRGLERLEWPGALWHVDVG